MKHVDTNKPKIDRRVFTQIAVAGIGSVTGAVSRQVGDLDAGRPQRPCQQNVQLPSRDVWAVLDLTPSFRMLDSSLASLKKVVSNLGPGDQFHLIELGGPFNPRTCVTIQSQLPSTPACTTRGAYRFRERRDCQLEFDATRKRATAIQGGILNYLDHNPWRERDVTPLYKVLAYTAHRLSSTDDSASKLLLLYSDLIQDSDGTKSVLPPRESLTMTGVSATALFVPWDGSWASREAAWREWFVGHCGAASFGMLDASQSNIYSALTQSPAIRKLADCLHTS
jgi:hypothetical protein